MEEDGGEHTIWRQIRRCRGGLHDGLGFEQLSLAWNWNDSSRHHTHANTTIHLHSEDWQKKFGKMDWKTTAAAWVGKAESGCGGWKLEARTEKSKNQKLMLIYNRMNHTKNH